MTDQDFFQRIEIALKVYHTQNNIVQGEQIQLDLFINWLYNQYGIVRKGAANDSKVDTV
jgi:hypothetical protein